MGDPHANWSFRVARPREGPPKIESVHTQKDRIRPKPWDDAVTAQRIGANARIMTASILRIPRVTNATRGELARRI